MASKQIKYFLASLALLIVSTSLTASTIIDAIATQVEGYDIPIKIMLPDNTTGKSPVFFFVHGGGWNGGTATEVPKASLPNDAYYLCDQLGIIYVGLAYRCKGNDASFSLALEDLESSIAWFTSIANEYNADITRIGFGGGSAGTTLSAILAQRYPLCDLYIGREGMYNVMDQDPNLSFFPSKEGKQLYGLTTKKEQFEASAYYNLKNNPASVLLFHGKDDLLCHYSQSEKYAHQIKKAGGKAKVILYEHINHTCLNPNYPEVFKNSLMAMAHFYADEYHLEHVDFKAIETNLDNRLTGMYASDNITDEQLIGTWNNKSEQIVLNKNGSGHILNKKDQQTTNIIYKNNGTSIYMVENDTLSRRTFYLRKNNNVIYELIENHSRLKSRRIDYQKQKL